MKRWNDLCLALGLALTLLGSVRADEPADGPARIAGATTEATARRRRVEASLQKPLDLPLGGRTTITLDDLVQHLRDRHRVAIRLDLATLRTLPNLEVNAAAGCDEAECEASCGNLPACGVKGKVAPVAGTSGSAKSGRTRVVCGAECSAATPAQGANSVAPLDAVSGAVPPVLLTEQLKSETPALAETDLPLACAATPTATCGNESDVSIRVVGNKVQLTGRVSTEKEKAKAELFARMVFAPKEIDSTITVGAPIPVGGPIEPAVNGWRTSLSKAEAEAKRRGIPLLIHFGATWCGPCQKMESSVLNDPEVVQQFERGIVAVKVDIDAEREAAARFNVSHIPTDVFVSSAGHEISRSSGYQSKNEYLRKLAGVEADFNRWAASTSPALPPKALTSEACPAPPPVVLGGVTPRIIVSEEECELCPSAACDACPNAACPGAACQEQPGVQLTTGVDALRTTPIRVADLALEGATIESALRQILSAISPPVQDGDTGVPVRITNMCDLDYLVLEDGVVVTTRLAANLRKETRVYKVPPAAGREPEALAKVITQTVRPWSWRTQVTEIAQQFVAQWPRSAKLPFQLDVGQGLKLASGDVAAKPEDMTADAIAALGPMLSAGGVAMVQAGVAALEIMHHGDPPTGVIQTLPGMLIITQSQGAHREIAELLQQVSAPVK